MKKTLILLFFIFASGCLLMGAPHSIAYQEYADVGFGGCDNCHGAFQDNRNYSSIKDGDWDSDLMDAHNIMVSDDCDTCHSGTLRLTVFMNISNGGTGLEPLSCIGCHGRAEDRGTARDCVDPDNPNPPCGDGVGLRQHHFRASPDFAGPMCLSCHPDTDPANATPVNEDVKPPYYSLDPDPNHPDKPTDPCNLNGEEDFAGTAIGLDNDGDLIFDGDDCSTSSTEPTLEIPVQVPADGGGTVAMPVTFTQNAADINSTAFSVDYDETNLTIDPAITMFPWPDAITIHPDILNNSFFWTIQISLDANDTDGELDVVFTSSSRLVPEGDLITITFDVGNPPVETEAPVIFSLDPSPSFGNTSGDSVPGTALNGSVLITPDCTPTAEICDGLDNDCDGSIDEGITPIPTTCGVGECASTGQTTCVEGSTGDTCTPGTPAADDATCDGLDNDCDGGIDEDFAPQATSCGVGACAATGQTTCVDGSAGDTCTPGTPGDEVCDEGNLDEDCDGTANEGCACTDGETRATSCGTGECAAMGIETCSGGVWGNDTCTPGTPTAEVCDNADNDCDGSTDEDLTRPTTCGVGECAGNMGEETCTGGTWGGDTCDPLTGAMPEGPPGEGTCSDMLDNDCDGFTDTGDSECTVVTGGEGCSKGYWKKEKHFDAWHGYSPFTPFSDVFADAFPGMTFLDVLRLGGGGLHSLGRQTVAALLNAASPHVSYDLSENEVIMMFNRAYPGMKKEYNNLKENFEDFNEQGCPLNSVSVEDEDNHYTTSDDGRTKPPKLCKGKRC